MISCQTLTRKEHRDPQITDIYYMVSLSGSFLVRISPHGPFPWKRSSAVYVLIFESRQIQNKHGPSAI